MMILNKQLYTALEGFTARQLLYTMTVFLHCHEHNFVYWGYVQLLRSMNFHLKMLSEESFLQPFLLSKEQF